MVLGRFLVAGKFEKLHRGRVNRQAASGWSEGIISTERLVATNINLAGARLRATADRRSTVEWSTHCRSSNTRRSGPVAVILAAPGALSERATERPPRGCGFASIVLN